MSTPARRQYLAIKAEHPDALLMYQVGDFFEFFDEDARTVAGALQIVLTSRSYGPDERVPLAGVPVHTRDGYAARLLALGYRVAVCEQVEVPTRGLVRRIVTRVLTPGTATEPAIAPAARDNYLAAVCHGRRGRIPAAGLAYIEASTGLFRCLEWHGDSVDDALAVELDRLSPAEVLIDQSAGVLATDDAGLARSYQVTPCPSHDFERTAAIRRLCRHFATPALDAFGCQDSPLAAAAAGAILAYLERTNPDLLRLVRGLQRESTDGYVQIDGRTWAALEVVVPAHLGTPSSTLLATIDATRTLMGARLLRRQLSQPLRDRTLIESRLDAVEALHGDGPLRQYLARCIDGLPDLERLVARVAQGSAEPKDVLALSESLRHIATHVVELGADTPPALAHVVAELDPCPEACAEIDRALDADDGASLFRRGYDGALDELVAGIADARAWIARLEGVERERTGIKSLKVSYNKVFGYGIEVTRPHVAKVPPEYERRQTLVTGERYVTTALKEREAQVLQAEVRIAARERDLYAALLRTLAKYSDRLLRTAQALAQLDIWLGLAEVAVLRDYTRPRLTESGELTIVGGRHPVVESALHERQFIANDTYLDAAEHGAVPRMLLLTGPNMAGKSTYLRQVAQIVLLAQFGSYVPAQAATIGLVDRIFARVGADDDLARGVSTFLREMSETAFMLRHATRRSLIILDEVGRGTSTRDGQALAQAVLEHVHDRIGARTLFATHFHDLAALRRELPRLQVAAMEVEERDGAVAFLHRLHLDSVGQSYGVHVARMAGVPESVTLRAKDLLELPQNAVAESVVPYGDQVDGVPCDPCALVQPERILREQMRAVPAPIRQVVLALAGCNVAAITPIDAINVLFSLQQRAAACLPELEA